MALTALDWGLIGAYVAVVILIGVRVTTKVTSAQELFLAGRSLGFATVGFSLFASNISSTTIIGVAGAAYQNGISVAHYELMAALVLIFMAFVTIPVFLRAQITTVPEYLQRRFGPFVCKYVSALTIVLSIFVDTAGSIYAGVLVLQTLIPGLPFVPACIALAAFAGLYTAFGGLRAVVYTDVLQAIILLAGTGVITYVLFEQFDFSWSAAMAAVPSDKLSLIRPLDDPALPWLGVLVGLPILGFYYWAANQYIMQRVLGAKNLEHARWGAMLAAALKLLPLFLFAIPGALAFALLPGLPDGDQVFPTMIVTYLPAGLVGLVLAGLIAAIMSTIDSTLNSASALVVYDFVNASEHKLSPRRTLWLGRLTTLVFVVIAAFWPLVIRHFPGLFNYIQQVFSLAVPPVAAVFLLAMFWWRATTAGAITALVLGHTIGCAIFVWKIWCSMHGVADGLPHFTIVAGATALLCLLVAVGVSLAQPRGQTVSVPSLLWTPRDTRPDCGDRWDYRWAAAAIGAAVIMLIWMFR
ncbi:sodium/solute symporter [Hyphomicrobium sp. CS1GBMeth3]|uniref:sodium:solute symporter family transporter n=1 Tax=Hyphomicrobium sp. CS1GBMeth3 TaxID=1892845 RepID=UPI0009311ACC|nr:sodium/solute symporter [Hyphomicrobium sp. CS1GBMeth3]